MAVKRPVMVIRVPTFHLIRSALISAISRRRVSTSSLVDELLLVLDPDDRLSGLAGCLLIHVRRLESLEQLEYNGSHMLISWPGPDTLSLPFPPPL